MKKQTADRMHKKHRKSNRGWIFALVGVLVLLAGIVWVLLMFGNLSAGSGTTTRQTAAVNVEKDIPETDLGDLVYHEPAAENIVMQGGFGYVNNELLVTLDSADSLSALKDYLRTIGSEVVGEIPITADYQILFPAAHTQEELEQMIEQLKALPYVRRSSLNYAFELENDAISGSSAYYPNDEKWDSWSGDSGNNWNMRAIDAPGAWAYRDQVQPVNVGVVDSIFYPYHEDLKDVFQEMPLGNVVDMGIERYNGGGTWTKSDIHGTHVAGIIAAKFDNGKGICGVAPNVKLYGADVHSESLTKYSSEGKWYRGDWYFLKIAFAYLVATKRCHVINFSQGLPDNILYSASRGDEYAHGEVKAANVDLSGFLKQLKDKTKTEFIICEAAGNGQDKKFFKKDDDDKEGERYLLYSDYLEYMNGDTSKAGVFQRYRGRITEDICESKGIDAQYNIFGGITDPEIQDMILVVGAAQPAGEHSTLGKCHHTGYAVTSYSNRGTRVDLIAPGGNGKSGSPDSWIYSTVPIGDGYLEADGTSMACPHVAGVAAMIFGIDPTFTAKEVKKIITDTATGSYGEEGYPMLNARRAVEKAIALRDEKAKTGEESPSPAESTDGHRYEIFHDTLTWEEAKAACEAKGGHLATIASPEEQAAIEALNTQNDRLWIGGSRNAAGQWCWVTGEPWVYTNWGEGEPNNSSNVVAGESCVAVWPSKWNDLANSNKYEQSGYVCEWETSDAVEETQVEGYTGHLYEFYTLPESEWESGPITWKQAERRCEWKGGHLAVIESATENGLLYNAMRVKGYKNAYFGLSDQDFEGNWKWVDGTQARYTNWHDGEPNDQNGVEHYAMFYEKFNDDTWNDADGVIDANCAYICEWDDPADRSAVSDTLTERQLKIIARDLSVPEDLAVTFRQSPKTYWEAAGLWDIYVEIFHDGKLVASGSFDLETGELGRNVYIYAPA